MKFKKDHLCSACEQEKIHRKHHKSKTAFASNKPLYLLHMDLCGLMRVESLNGKRYNKNLAKFFDKVGITQQFFAARTPQQNGVVEKRNRTLVEAARTMLSFANLPLFIWAEAFATTCFIQNHSIIHKHFDKTPYELMNKIKPNIKFFRVFGCRCYLLNDYEDVGKLKAKRDIGVFVGYSKESVSQVSETSKKDLEDLFQNFYDEYFDSSKIMKSSTTNVETSNVEIPSSEEVEVPSSNTQSILNNMIPNVDEASTPHNVFNKRLEDAYFDASTSFHDPSNVHTFYQPYPHEKKWTKDHPLHKIIGDPKSSVRTRGQLANSCLFSCLPSSIEPANVAEALKDADWTAFLNGFLKEEVYVGQPPGFVSKHYPDHVYALDKALYGLKQAPRAWYDVLSQFLIDNGFQKGSIDTTLFIKKKVPTPMVEQAKLKLDLVGKPVNHTDYRSMIGSLMYVTSSRPDIMFSTWTINLGLWYPNDSGFDLTAYLDADHAGCHRDRKKSKYVAVSSCYAQVLWMRTQLTDYGFFYDKVLIYCDSKSAVAISCNLIQVAQKKVKIAFENADSSSRVKLIPSKIKYANKVILNFRKELSVFSSFKEKEITDYFRITRSSIRKKPSLKIPNVNSPKSIRHEVPRVLTEDVVRSLSALISCRDLDTTKLRDFIDYDEEKAGHQNFGTAAEEACYRLSLFEALSALEILHSRSPARNLFPPLDNPEFTIRRRSRTYPTLLNNSEMVAEGNDDLPVHDLRTMEELCQPSLNGRGGPIASIAIQATNFRLKNDMIQ
nr:hypothetical protein [Tanacetum cinerariifolium]